MSYSKDLPIDHFPEKDLKVFTDKVRAPMAGVIS